MTVRDAINVLGIKNEEITTEVLKEHYRKAAKKYHPDINEAGEQMMKLINDAHETLGNENFPISVNSVGSENFDYGAEINKALNAIINIQGISIEVCGAWVWVSGETKDNWPKFKEAGFYFAPKKKQVYYRPPNFKSRSRGKTYSMDDIRNKYGSKGVKSNLNYQISSHRA